MAKTPAHQITVPIHETSGMFLRLPMQATGMERLVLIHIGNRAGSWSTPCFVVRRSMGEPARFLSPSARPLSKHKGRASGQRSARGEATARESTSQKVECRQAQIARGECQQRKACRPSPSDCRQRGGHTVKPPSLAAPFLKGESHHGPARRRP